MVTLGQTAKWLLKRGLNKYGLSVKKVAVSGSSTVYLSDLFREYFIKVFSQFCSLRSLRPQVTKKGKIIENTMVGISIAKLYPWNHDSEDPW